MQTAEKILELVSVLSAERPFDAKRVASLTGVTLSKNEERSSGSTLVSRSADTPEAAIRSIEVRTPRQPDEKNGGMILISLGKATEISKDQIIARFGRDAKIMPNPPRLPEGMPVWMEYKLPWGRLRFGMAPDGDHRLLDVVLDATND